MAGIIYHEKQDAALCGVHCLNNLVQGAFFSEIDLMTIAQRLDQEEKDMMAAQGLDSKEFLNYMAEESGNVSDSGDFSIQVMSEALKNFGLSCEIMSSERERDRVNFDDETGFICNFRQHWFTIRKLAATWWNLDSLKDEAEFVSPTYMSLLLAQLRAEGYSIFAVRGNFPKCLAEENPQVVQQLANERVLKSPKVQAAGRALGHATQAQDDDLAKALQMSLEGQDDPDLAMALAMSMQQGNEHAKSIPQGVNIPPEPPAGEDNVAHVVMILPGGDRIERRFRGGDRLEAVLAYSAQGAGLPAVELVTAYPSQVFSDGMKKVEECGFVPKVLVHVQPRRAA